jgi:hypothetical protein
MNRRPTWRRDACRWGCDRMWRRRCRMELTFPGAQVPVDSWVVGTLVEGEWYSSPPLSGILAPPMVSLSRPCIRRRPLDTSYKAGPAARNQVLASQAARQPGTELSSEQHRLAPNPKVALRANRGGSTSASHRPPICLLLAVREGWVRQARHQKQPERSGVSRHLFARVSGGGRGAVACCLSSGTNRAELNQIWQDSRTRCWGNRQLS